MDTSRANWATERIAGAAKCYEYFDAYGVVTMWVVACNREQADAVIVEHETEVPIEDYVVRERDEAWMRNTLIRPDSVGELDNMWDAFVEHCTNYAVAGIIGCTEE